MKKLVTMMLLLSLSLSLSLLKDTSGQEPSPNEVFFNDGALKPLIELIDNAKESISAQIFTFSNYEPIISALEKAAKRNVNVCLLIDNQGSNRPIATQDGVFSGCPEERLEKVGAIVKWDKQSKMMHRKVAVFDYATIFMGSSNWSNNAFEVNDEIDICLKDELLAGTILAQFEKDWKEAEEEFPRKSDDLLQENDAPSTPTDLKAEVADKSVVLSWSNQDEIEPAGYNIYRAIGDGLFVTKRINDSLIGGLKFTDENVKFGKKYRYRVTAIGSDLESAPSDEVTVEIPLELLKVENLKASFKNGKVKLTWDSNQKYDFVIARNGTECERTVNKSWEDENPPKEKLTYSVAPFYEEYVGPKSTIEIDLTPPPPKPVNFIGNTTTKKYHKLDCRYAKETKPVNRVEFESKLEAEKAGYTACKVCKP